jgi:hypothetical protein
MLHSEYASASQRAIDYVKSRVKYRGLNTAGGWIREPADVVQKFAARIESLSEGSRRSAQHQGGFVGSIYVNELEKLALETQTGNCSELSAVAFNHLERTGVRPIDYFAVFRGGWNHAFVVLNRDASIPIGDFAKWSERAVVCDPLYDRSAIAGMLAPWYPRAIPFRAADVKHRLE